MSDMGESRRIRDVLFGAYQDAMDEFRLLMQKPEPPPEADRAYERAGSYEREYLQALPRVTVCPCPFDGKPLIRSFDPYGLDGPWWSSNATPPELPTCPHFCALGGAVHFQGQPPFSGRQEVRPGPEVPYVYPRLLSMPGMIAVISELAMDRGYNDYKLFASWTAQGIFFVTRLKDNADYAVVSSNAVPQNRNILSDQLIHFTGFCAQKDCPHILRRVVVWDEEKQQAIVLLTNHLAFGSTTISAIYKDRWQIELFFKALKQNLKIKRLSVLRTMLCIFKFGQH